VKSLAKALGVTRVARVTGLDRCGVEVACAVRPGGHVLQISNGKGATFEQAARSALSEAAELWAAERFDPAQCLFGSLEELPGAWAADEVGCELVAPRLWSPRTRLAFRRARELFSGDEVLVPAQAVHCPPPGSAQLGPALLRWTSNGSGAHPQRAAALQHALLEAIERDQVAKALPHGWTPAALRARKLAPVRTNGMSGLEAHFFDLTDDIPLPVVAALLVDLEEGPVPVAAGYACALTQEAAMEGAFLEAAQSRLTDVHGAREDVAPIDRAEALELARACRGVRKAGRGRQGRAAKGPLAALRRAGFRRAAVVELAAEPLHVVKVLVPGLRVSELL
jgi:ribosomal protein S12 methylthiotransferase accessory factor